MIYGSPTNHNINRIERVDSDRQEDERRDGKKKKVQYQGRAWAETEEDLPVQPAIPQNTPLKGIRHSSAGVYADRILLERAQNLLNHMTTLEEKAAQLCFFLTEAIYDAEIQHEVEAVIQTLQIGGILFQKGEYRRQAFLIEHYQQISKTPLLMVNDFLHGLSFYLQGDIFPTVVTDQHSSDLGKAVMVQNRRLGVQIQFDRERDISKVYLNEMQAKAFRKGIRSAQGIVGKEKVELQAKFATLAKEYSSALSNNLKITPTLTDQQVQDTISFKTLTFFDAAQEGNASLENVLLGAFQQSYEAFILKDNISAAIRAIVHLVETGKIQEEVFERHVLKILIIKSLFFK